MCTESTGSVMDANIYIGSGETMVVAGSEASQLSSRAVLFAVRVQRVQPQRSHTSD